MPTTHLLRPRKPWAPTAPPRSSLEAGLPY
jgi:hypothetical protein